VAEQILALVKHRMSNLLGLEEEVPNTPVGLEQSEIEQRLKKGANWFYWIAGLSLVNSITFALGSPVSFLGGLGFTLVIDVFVNAIIEAGGPAMLRAIAIIFNLILFAIFALFGYYSGKRFKGAFFAGTIIYFLDGLMVLLFGDFMMAGFHAFALIFIIRGYMACRELKAEKIEQQTNWTPDLERIDA
jgi:TRAP-type C4-dicarboxylate transport system permease small subunit